MKPRVFHAPHMMAALEAVQQELGPEALVLSVRQSQAGPAWQVWRRPGVEVMAVPGPAVSKGAVVGVDRQTAGGLTRPPAHDDSAKVQPSPGSSKSSLAAKLPTTYGPQPFVPPQAAVSSQKDHHRDLPPTARAQTAPRSLSAASNLIRPESTARLSVSHGAAAELGVIGLVRRRLITQGVDEKLLDGLIKTCVEVLGPAVLGDERTIQKTIQAQLTAGLRIMKEEDFASERVLCLAGASGVGKTSVTAKLAAHYTRLGRMVAWVCADTVRAGAIAEAQACAGSLGVPLHLAYTPGDLAAATGASPADLTLVDMPNCNPRREADIVAQGDLLAALPRRSIYLVTPATANDADLQQALAALGPFDLKGLIATKLDEGEMVGSIFNAAWRSRLPLAYFTDGPRVLDDLQPAQAIKLVERLFKNR